MDQISREQVIQLAREIADRLGVDRLTRSTFCRESGMAIHRIYALFPEGGWTAILQAAKLQCRGSGYSLDDEELLAEFHRVASLLGRIPTWAVLQARATISADTIRRRFGGRQGTLSRYRDWLEQYVPNSPLLEQLATRSKKEILMPPQHELARQSTSGSEWPRSNRTEYGPPLNFRGLQHAPINEQGVVYLFGMVSSELGFMVETIQEGYPDCEAKRCVDQRQNRWQRVRIEFEYRSSNFRDHGHDPNKCDMIICWEHDWLQCSLEVLELRTIISSL